MAAQPLRVTSNYNVPQNFFISQDNYIKLYLVWASQLLEPGLAATRRLRDKISQFMTEADKPEVISFLKGTMYEHSEGLPYEMVGLVEPARSDEIIGVTKIHRARSAEGYESTGEVGDDEIDVFRLPSDGGGSEGALKYLPVGDSGVDGKVVVYIQRRKGKQYPEGQPWYRSEDDFRNNFRLVE